MDKAALAHAKLLLPHCLNQQGALDADRIKQVVQALMASQLSGKAAILRQLKRLVAQEQSRQQAVVTSVEPLTEATKKHISTYISSVNPAIRSISWQQDPELLGGFTIRMGDMWYDISLAHDLQTIREQLSQ